MSDFEAWISARFDEYEATVMQQTGAAIGEPDADTYSTFLAEAFLGLPLQERARMANLGMILSIVNPQQGRETEDVRFGVEAKWVDRDDESWRQARATPLTEAALPGWKPAPIEAEEPK